MENGFFVLAGFLAPVGYSEQNLGTDMGYYGAIGKEVEHNGESFHIGAMEYCEDELNGEELVGVIFASESIYGWEYKDANKLKDAIEEANNKLDEVKNAMKSVLPSSDHELIDQSKVLIWTGPYY